MKFRKKSTVVYVSLGALFLLIWFVLLWEYFDKGKINDYQVFSNEIFSTSAGYISTDRMFPFFVVIAFSVGFYYIFNDGNWNCLLRMGKEKYVFFESKKIVFYCAVIALIYVGINYIGLFFMCDINMLKECKFTLLNFLCFVTVFLYFLVCANLINFAKYVFSFNKVYFFVSLILIIFQEGMYQIGLNKYSMISYFDYIDDWLYNFEFDWGTYVIHCVISVLFAIAFVYGSVLIFKRRDLLTDEEA